MRGIIETKEDLRGANHAVRATDGKFPTAAPTSKDDAMGRIPDGNILNVEVGELGSGSVVITMLKWSCVQERWIYPGSVGSNFTKTFASANMPAHEFFKGCAGDLYALYADTADVKGWDNGDDV